MKKSLLFVLALLLTMIFSTGTVLASSDKDADWKNSYKEKKHVQERVKKSVQEAFKVYLKEKPSQDKNQFSDLKEHWATRSIEDMAAVGLFKGYPDGTFKPNQELTQVEALALVMRIYDEDAATTTTDNDITVDEEDDLADVPAWASDNAKKAHKKGIIKLNRFHSGVQASRAQTAVMIAKALELEPVDTSNMPFKDGLLISKEDIGYILALYEEGILKGDPNGNFNPNSFITRAEMATMLERLLDKSEIESVTLPATATVQQGESITLTAVVKYADGTTNDQVTWLSSDATLATVDDGVITAAANKTGTVTITATATRGDASKSDTCIVTVSEESELESVTLPTTATVEQGESITLTAVVKYADGTTDNQVTWSSSNTALATVQNGVVTAVAGKTGNVTITATATHDGLTKSDTCIVTVVEEEQIINGTLEATDNVGSHDGKVYVEYELEVNDLPISLAQDEVKSITLQKEGSSAVQLTPNTDSTLWFNVQRTSGEYTLTVVDNDDVSYEAILDWNAPTAVTAVATGESRVQNGNTYVEYELGDLDLTSFDNMQQIKPDGHVVGLTVSSDTNLWFQTNQQVTGEHIFLIQQDNTWYSAKITI